MRRRFGEHRESTFAVEFPLAAELVIILGVADIAGVEGVGGHAGRSSHLIAVDTAFERTELAAVGPRGGELQTAVLDRPLDFDLVKIAGKFVPFHFELDPGRGDLLAEADEIKNP